MCVQTTSTAPIRSSFASYSSSETSPGIASGVRTPPPTNPKVHPPIGTASPSTNRMPSGLTARSRSGTSTLPNVT